MDALKIFILLLIIPLIPATAAEEKALPRVLILGDSVYNVPSQSTAAQLKGKAEVVYVRLEPGEVLNTTLALEHLDRLLGNLDKNDNKIDPENRKKWDVIHFNFGLGDLVHRAPGMKAFRVMPIHAGGVRATSPQQYEKNLQELVKRLKATGAKLVWVSTTPIRHSSTNVFKMGSEIEYNAIAAKVMAEANVPINDMYSHVKSLIDMTKPAGHGADPFYFDRKPLHPPITQAILGELNLR